MNVISWGFPVPRGPEVAGLTAVWCIDIEKRVSRKKEGRPPSSEVPLKSYQKGNLGSSRSSSCENPEQSFRNASATTH